MTSQKTGHRTGILAVQDFKMTCTEVKAVQWTEIWKFM